MKVSQYQELASRTIPMVSSKMVVDGTHFQLLNFCLGLFGEAGELVDHIKKHIFHGHPLDMEYVSKELGDIQWYTCGLATLLGLDSGNIAIENIEKLMARYPNGFSQTDSINRVDKKNQEEWLCRLERGKIEPPNNMELMYALALHYQTKPGILLISAGFMPVLDCPICVTNPELVYEAIVKAQEEFTKAQFVARAVND